MMVSMRMFAIAAGLTLAQLALADSVILPRAPINAFGIVQDEEETTTNDYAAKFAPHALLGEKNASVPLVKERSLGLEERQTCNAGYGYCSAFGRCCPSTDNCCPYGYCIDPADTCCPDAPCKPNWGCCGPNCYPKGGDCCSDYNYCEAGNMCVKLGSTGEIVCCTDLQCTAAVVSGTTSYLSTLEFSTPVFSTTAESITPPPSVTAQATSFVGGDDEWYWTVTWWYLSFYWTVFQTSEVTWTTIYETTTYTTTATDREQALSEFSALSATLTFPVPADAHTSLIYYLTAEPSQTDSFPSATGFTFNPQAFSSSIQPTEVIITKTAAPHTTTSTTSSSSTTIQVASSTVTPAAGVQAVQVGYISLVGALVAVPGVLMVWL
ncbi:uncharacterized protein BDZ99DRAFT_462451 [Mytilinidion resinicola]|uniref:GPI anchored protein n=1 Tax=Mytilinidion resinicola TaxID=574789 RepID=A0A6A6YT23_9PEZI|nr:uncharacterized protein BDZ99DRAFT_462451 [Mytilinidion resinicola]KAF2811184.1 hypothetical protein BDZ99DRAFT_462451 [Mytilinidion resinicola]